MSYAIQVGLRYLRSKKRATVSVITFIAVTGVALGVGALLAVMSITSGFQEEFRDKVLGVNAHVLVLKYGLNFDEYRDVVARGERMPEVRGAAPFLINEMMLAKDDQLQGVLVKGVDPELMPRVLDLPGQLIEGSLEGLRLERSAPPVSPEDFERAPTDEETRDLDAYLRSLADGGVLDSVVGGDSERAADAGAPAAAGEPAADEHGVAELPAEEQPPDEHEPAAADGQPLPQVQVPTPGDVEAALGELQLGELPSDEAEQDLIADSKPDEEPPEPTEELPGVVVGKTLAENLQLEVGQRVKVISPLSGLDTSLWEQQAPATPKSRDFRVIGIFEAGFQEYDSRLVYVDLYEAQRMHGHGDTVIGVEISLHDIDKASAVASELERELGAGPFHTMDWKELNHNLFTALEIQKVMLSLVIATIILVAAFNVIATLIMIVLEKRREIAILKAMGAKDSSVMQIFVFQGTTIGLLGTAIGLLVGGAVCAYLSAFQFPLDPKVYLIDHLPVRTSAVEFALTVGISLLICVTATVIPSWWAARLLPVDGIRYH